MLHNNIQQGIAILIARVQKVQNGKHYSSTVCLQDVGTTIYTTQTHPHCWRDHCALRDAVVAR